MGTAIVTGAAPNSPRPSKAKFHEMRRFDGPIACSCTNAADLVFVARERHPRSPTTLRSELCGRRNLAQPERLEMTCQFSWVRRPARDWLRVKSTGMCSLRMLRPTARILAQQRGCFGRDKTRQTALKSLRLSMANRSFRGQYCYVAVTALPTNLAYIFQKFGFSRRLAVLAVS